MKKLLLLPFLLLFACNQEANKENNKIKKEVKPATPFVWNGANVYFLLTDRFHNGDSTNDQSYDRKLDGAPLRSFLGGDIKGVTQKIEAGYFNDLGISAIWMNPIVEQIRGYTDEGTGKTYPFHGYWTRDWTNIDPNFGSLSDYADYVKAAHSKGLRVIMDVVINHTGPVTKIDSQWPEEWVRTSPTCTYQDYQTTVECTLVKNLPDIKTESQEEVELPAFLIQKWKEEGRYEQEVSELDDFFERTGYPRYPRYYIIKWLVDYVAELGIDGFRVDTVKHTEPDLWDALYKEAQIAFARWKENNPADVLDDTDFYMVGEVYNYSVYHGRDFEIGPDHYIDFYENGLQSLINFSLKGQSESSLEEISSEYSAILNGGTLDGVGIMNYITSHDDGSPYDRERTKTYESATKLLLAPGTAQVYYGDETARDLTIEEAAGDATLRSFMNWENLKNNSETKALWEYYAKLGQFRKMNPAIGAGTHTKISDSPYTFKREYRDGSYENKVIVSLENEKGEVDVSSVFQEGDMLRDYFSGAESVVKDGKALFNDFDQRIMLVGLK